MTRKAKVTLPGRVDKLIEPVADEKEKAQISIDGADPLYGEIRIENTLTNQEGQKVRLQPKDEVDVTVEADEVAADDNSKNAAHNTRQKPKQPRFRVFESRAGDGEQNANRTTNHTRGTDYSK